MTKIHGSIDYNDGDQDYVRQFNDQVHLVTGAVVEMMLENPAILLSPVFRKMVANEARNLEAMRLVLDNRLVIDNPGDPLSEKWPQ